MPSLDSDANRVFGFGPFRLNKSQKLLSEHGAPVRVGSRAIELLVLLVERPFEVLSRQDIEAHVWPHTVVEETSLRVHVAALRKALRDGVDGARYITNIPGRGYCFVAPVQMHSDARQPAAAIAIAANRAFNNLPSRLSKVFGRQEVTAAIGALFLQHRLVSVAGPGGIGKTTVAVAAAAEHIARYEHGAAFVDFSPISAPELVPSTVALALGCQHASGSMLEQLGEFLRDRRVRLVLDNCEHVIDAAAALVERVMSVAPDVHILATTREPLFAEGEWVYRLQALDAPGVDDELTHEQAVTYPAIRLFTERAEANSSGFALSPETLPAVRQLCRRLDGIPLAIELAAARVGSLGVLALAQRLDDLFQLLNRGRRTAMPRHQTLEALLDWSHDLLNERERVVLRRLSVFRSSFELASAVSVAAADDLEASMVTECVSSLALKSLINSATSGSVTQFRLLYMTRVYASRKLEASGEMRRLQLRHASHFLETAASAVEHWGLTGAERIGTFSPLIDDLRAAMDWAFSPDGDDELGVQLISNGWTATVALGLFNEYQTRVDVALERVAHLVPKQPKLELALCVCWCFLSGQTRGIDGARQKEMFDRVLSLAAQAPDLERHVEALYAVTVGCLGQGRYDVAKELLTRIKNVVGEETHPLSVLVGDRLLVLVHHHLGNHAQARKLAGRVIQFDAHPRHARLIGQVPRSVSMVIVEARILWLEGASDRATVAAHQAVENAIGEHPFVLSQALALAAIPIALWRGDVVQARELTCALRDHATRHSLPYWQSWAEGYARALAYDELSRGPTPFVKCDWTSSPGELDMLATLSPDFLSTAAVSRVEDNLVAWCSPEILRVQAVHLLRSGEGSNDEAQSLLMRALDIARAQGALAWVLRIATTLAASCPPSLGRDTADLLSETLGRFVEGLHTRDLVRGRDALTALERVLQQSIDRAS